MQKLRRELMGAEPALLLPHSPAAAARQILDQSRLRNHFIPGASFEDPQWMILLELYVASEEGREISISTLCSASGVPSTTALRHIRHLQTIGFLRRVSHPNDKRISLVCITETARNQISRYLIAITPRVASAGVRTPPRAGY